MSKKKHKTRPNEQTISSRVAKNKKKAQTEDQRTSPSRSVVSVNAMVGVLSDCCPIVVVLGRAVGDGRKHMLSAVTVIIITVAQIVRTVFCFLASTPFSPF